MGSYATTKMYRKLYNMESICLYLHKEIQKRYKENLKRGKQEGLVSNRVAGTERGVRLSNINSLIFICEMLGYYSCFEIKF